MCYVPHRILSEFFYDSFDKDIREDIWVANGTKMKYSGRRSGKLQLLYLASKKRTVTMDAVLFVPQITR